MQVTRTTAKAPLRQCLPMMNTPIVRIETANLTPIRAKATISVVD